MMGIIKKFMNFDKDQSLVRDSFILLVSTTILNFASFAYHFYIGRALGPEAYGIFGAILSLMYVTSIPYTTIQTSISKFVSKFKVQREEGKIKYLLIQSSKKILIFGGILSLFFVLLIPFLSTFLKVPQPYLVFIIFFLLSYLLLAVIRGILQGIQKFKALGFNMVLEGISKFAIGVFLVSLGFGLFGAVGGFIGSVIISLLFGFYPLKNILKEKKKKVISKEIYEYSLPVFFVLLSLTAFYSVDIILVKHFFNNQEAGYYTALSLLARTVYYASFAIILVMFPKVTELHITKKDTGYIYKKTLFLVSLIGVPMIAFYFLFPKFTTVVFFGKNFLPIQSMVGWFSLVMFLYSLVWVVCFYNLSRNRTNFIYILFFANILQVILIWLFHSTLMAVILILLIIVILELLALLINVRVEVNHET